MTAHQSRIPVRALRIAASLLVVAALASCSGSGLSQSSSTSAGGPDSAAEPRAADAAAAVGEAAAKPGGAGSGSGGGTEPLSPSEPALIKTAAISLQADDIGATVARIDSVVVDAGGQFASEQTSTNSRGLPVWSSLEVKVPSGSFDESFTAISKLGTLVDKSRSAEDVTSRLADVDSRVRSARDSISQLRALFSQAVKLSDVIALERELSDREADLEALQATQRTLRSRTTLSTIAVTLSRPTPKATADKAGGFVAGLKDGWQALLTFVQASAHGLGLVLPLGTLVLLVAAAVRAVVRRFMPRQDPALPGSAGSE